MNIGSQRSPTFSICWLLILSITRLSVINNYCTIDLLFFINGQIKSIHSEILFHINCFISLIFIQCRVLALLFILLKHITSCLAHVLCSRPFFIVFNQFDMVLLPRIFIHREQENIHAILSGFNCLQLQKTNEHVYWHETMKFDVTSYVSNYIKNWMHSLDRVSTILPEYAFFVESSSVIFVYKFSIRN